MNIRFALVGCMVGLVCSFCCEAQEQPPLPSLSALKVSAAPVLDGKLDDSCWAKAPAATNFWIWDGSGRSENSATARLVYDDQNLYVAFYCPLKDAEALEEAKAVKAETILGAKHIVEVFLEPYPYHARIYHFMVNAANGRHSELNGNSQWQTQWTSATFIGKDFWSAEIVIPFAALACGD
ncbi:MAG: hypothetical protein GX629_05180, partial [Phycisphaerae bacterium]|nr:hypothetical protein [Phycisphaerae bacterium]